MGNPIKDTIADFGVDDNNDMNGNTLKDIKNITFEAIKNDKDKTRMDLLPPKALEGIAKIFTYGATKYADFNYKNGDGLDWNRPFAACLRHLNAWNSGEDNDKESGKSHLYHAGCCIMMLIDIIESGKGRDNRFGSNSV